MSAGLVLGAGYGIEIQEDNDPYVAMSQKTLDAIEAAVLPGSYLVDFIPACAHPFSFDVCDAGVTIAMEQ